MKKWTTFLILSLMALMATGQTDLRLKERLDSSLEFTRKKDFNSILDLTYPKLFDIVERSQMMSLLRNTFENDQFTIDVDSVQILTISPVISFEKGQYVKVRHTMRMIFHFRDTSGNEARETQKLTVGVMGMQYGEENVRYDEATYTMYVFTRPEMIAIKNEISPEWTFLNYKKDDMLTDFLLGKELHKKLQEN